MRRRENVPGLPAKYFHPRRDGRIFEKMFDDSFVDRLLSRLYLSRSISIYRLMDRSGCKGFHSESSERFGIQI